MKITKKSLIEEVTRDPNRSKILLDHGLHCIGCMASAFENLEQGFKAHGFSDKKMEEVIKELNSL